MLNAEEVDKINRKFIIPFDIKIKNIQKTALFAFFVKFRAFFGGLTPKLWAPLKPAH